MTIISAMGTLPFMTMVTILMSIMCPPVSIGCEVIKLKCVYVEFIYEWKDWLPVGYGRQ